MTPLTTCDQLLAHLLGDYVLQSHWMATEKTKRSLAAAAHALTYALPFGLLCTDSPAALAAIVLSHFAVDRWRLARYLVWWKNGYWRPRGGPLGNLAEATPTGYPADVPPFLAVWLLIAADNTVHLLCNGLAVRLLG